MNPNAVILASVVATAGLHLTVQLQTRGPGPENYRIVLGAFLLAAFLLLLAEVWPEGARGLALVILLTGIVMNGGQFFKLVTSVVD